MKHQKPAVVRNLAKVHYQKEGSDSFMIVGLEAFKTKNEITAAYGIEVSDCYFKSESWMEMLDDGTETCLIVSTGYVYGVSFGTVLRKETFTKVIAAIKKCGDSLGKAIRNSPKKPSVRVIEI